MTEADRRAYVIADNKLALNAGWDYEILAEELEALLDLGFDVEVVGFSLAEIDLTIEQGSRANPKSKIEPRIIPRLSKGQLSLGRAISGGWDGTDCYAVMHATATATPRF